MKMKMHRLSVLLGTGFVLAAPLHAATLAITDGGDGLPYGDTGGFVVDFDSTFTSWSTPLIAGQTYSVDSISIYEASDSNGNANNIPVYLSVFDSSFAGFNGATAASHLGFSDNAINHTLSLDTDPITYTFTNILVTADSDGALSGSGLLYFWWDTDQIRNNFGESGGPNPYQRIDSNPSATDPAYGTAVLAFGAIQGSRVPEIMISVTAVPEPSTAVLSGFAFLALLRRRRA